MKKRLKKKMHAHCLSGPSPDSNDYNFVPAPLSSIATADNLLTVNFQWSYAVTPITAYELRYQNVTAAINVWVPLADALPPATVTAFAVPGTVGDLIWVEIRARRGRSYSTWQRGATNLIS